MKNLYTSVFGSAIVFVLVLNLTGCGGGDGGGDSVSGPQTGQFVDSPVEGLRFETATQSGTTNSNGEFQYLSGETVTFYIGDFELGSATGAAQITPFELAGLAIPVTTAEVSNAIDDFYAAYENENNNTPLNISLNMATFMQTIDLDGDPDNGITIPEAFVELMNGQTIDFSLSYWDFEDELYNLIESGYPSDEGADDGIWGSEYRDVVWAPDALDHMYSSLGLIPTQRKITREARDDNNDGIIDYLELFAYDADGNRIMYAEDRDGEGTRRDMEIEYYDAQGRDVGYAEDSNGELPGGITYFERWTYFDDPNVSRWQEQMYEEDDDGDGPEPMSRRIYDVNGNRIARETVTDGVVTYRETYEYDENENRILSLVDEDGDGPNGISERTVTVYENNYITSRVTDSGSDGPEDDTFRVTYTYDANNRLLSEETDGDGAGEGGITYRVSYAYDESGRRTLTERDSDGDGENGTSYRETWQYNANGRVVLHIRDNDGDLSEAIALTETYEWNANNQETLFERDYNGDGIDFRRSSTYNENNQVTQQVYDYDGDGTNAASVRTTDYEYDVNNRRTLVQTTNQNGITYRQINTYHENGRRDMYSYEYDSDGIFPENSYGYRYAYNEAGRQILNERLNSGVVTRHTSYEYDVNGQQVAYVRDRDGDGPDPAYRYISNTSLEVVENGTGTVLRRETYTRDTNGRLIRTDIDADGDGPDGITEVTTVSYDENGNQTLNETRDETNAVVYRESWTYLNSFQLLNHEVDEDGDGPEAVSYRRTNTYEDGKLVLRETDDNGDADSGLNRTVYVYDDFGNLIRKEYDNDGMDGYADGVIDEVTNYAYTDVAVDWNDVLDEGYGHDRDE